MQGNWQHWINKNQDEDIQNNKNNTLCVGHSYTLTNTNVVNKT